MKRSISLVLVVLFAGSLLASAATLITKQQASRDAVNAVGGGTVTLPLKEKELGQIIWSVDVTGATQEYEVWVGGYTGKILRIIVQPLAPQPFSGAALASVSMQQAEQIALKKVGGGTVVQAQRDNWRGFRIWDIAITQPGFEYDVYVQTSNGAVLKVIKHINNAAAAPAFISKAQAVKIALNAVGGGKVLLNVLDKTDNPPNWSVDIHATNGKDYEVKVNARNGKVIAIIIGG